MALKSGFDGKVVFLNATCGKLQNKKAGLYGTSYGGKLTGIKIKDTKFEKQDGKAVQLAFLDEGVNEDGSKRKELCFISFNALSWTAQNFFARLPKLNLDKPFVFGVMGDENSDKITYVWLNQNGERVTPVENAVTRTRVKVNNKEQNDWSALFTHVEKVVAELQETRFKRVETEAPVSEIATPVEDDNIPF